MVIGQRTSLGSLHPVRRRSAHRLPAAILLLGLAVVAGLLAPAIPGASTCSAGGVDFEAPHCGSGSPSGGYDLCYDTSDDTLWVLDQGAGTICHYALSAFDPQISLLGTITHPFGGAVPFPPPPLPPFSPVSRGIAYDSLSDTLYILNATTQEIHQLLKDGTPVGTPISLFAPTPDANLLGLTYDSLSGTLWSRDVSNDQLVEFDPVTGLAIGFIDIPIPLGGVVYGSGLSFVDVAGTGYLEITYGDIFAFGAVRVVRLDLAGVPTGHEFDITGTSETMLGIARPPVGDTIYASGETVVAKLTCPTPALLPPTDLHVTADLNSNMTLTWTNHGNGIGGAYATVSVFRNGVPLLTAGAGDTATVTDVSPTPLGAVLSYTVEVTEGLETASATVDAQSGTGALLGHVQFAGNRISGLAYNSATGELYASDNSPTSGDIYIFDSDLIPLGSVATGLPNVRGIAYNSTLDQVGLTRSGLSTVRRFDPTTWTDLGGFTTPGTDLWGLSYDPINDDYLVIAGTTSRSMIAFDAEPVSLGLMQWTSAPPLTSGMQLAWGVTHTPPDPLSPDGYSLAPVHDGSGVTPQAQQFFPLNCFPTSFSVPLRELGATSLMPDTITGIEDVGNVVFVADQATNTLFKLLLAPAGANFVRGDANQDTLIDSADVIFVLDYLYNGGLMPECEDAADANDDGRLDISDPLYLIFWLFLGAPAPPAPWPVEGPDPTFVDLLGC